MNKFTAIAAAVFISLNALAAHKYVRTASAGAGNGNDWNNAWSLAQLNSNWGSIAPGDTVWIAGGTYPSGTGMNVTASGNAANPIYIRRPLSTDAVPTAAAGWSAGFDSTPIITSATALRAGVSYLYVDGRVSMGIRFVASNSSGLPASANVTGGNQITLTNVDLVGPNSAAFPDGTSCGNTLATFVSDCSGMMIGYGYSPNPGADNIKITHSRVRGHANEFWFAGARNITIEHCMIYDNGAANSATWHGNLMIVNGSDGIIFRYNDVFNWQVEGLYPWGSASRNWHVYGNVFHDGYNGISGSTHRFLEIRSFSGSVTHGPFYVYNNTVTRCWAAFTRGDTTAFYSPDSVIRNNLVYNTANSGVGYVTGTINGNNLYASADPFTSTAGRDYTITSGSQARNAGVAISDVAGHTYSTDLAGNARGVDGTWDVGAYEYGSTGPSTNPVISVVPSSLNFGWVRVGATSNLTITVQNIGQGTLTGSASASAPFSVSNGSYSLGSNQTKVVTVIYTPTTAGNQSGVVAFSGASGSSVSASGVSYTNQSGYHWLARNGTLVSPMAASANVISATGDSSSAVSTDGYALFGFTVASNGYYYLDVNARGETSGADSFYVQIDGVPVAQTNTWDILPATTGFENRVVSWRGGGTFDAPQYETNLWNLTTGNHLLAIFRREPGAAISNITLRAYSATPSPNLIPSGAEYSAEQTGSYTLLGLVAGETYTLTAGNAQYLSRSAGFPTTVVLTNSGDFTVLDGYTYVIFGPTSPSPTGPYPNVPVTADVRLSQETNAPPVLPFILQQPQNIRLTNAQSGSFSIQADGTTPLSYQWKKDGSNIPGATSTTYTISNADAGDAGVYAVTISNVVGLTISYAAEAVFVDNRPQIITSPTPFKIYVGSPLVITGASSGATLTSWRKDGGIVAINTNAIVKPAQVSDSGIYTFVAANESGETNTVPIRVRVYQSSNMVASAVNATTISVE